MAGTVTAEQIEKLNAVVGEKATSLSSAVIRLHTATGEEKKWIYSGLCGALCFVIDRQLGGVAFFRMYDLNNFDMLFETELYMDFKRYYQEANDYFFYFPIAGGNIIGLSFADSNEAITFRTLVDKYAPKLEKGLAPKKIRNDEEASGPNDQPKKKGLFGDLFKKKKIANVDDLDPNDPKALEDYYLGLKVSRPENAVLENHIGWDQAKQKFDITKLSKDFKTIFKNAGIRKKDLEDKDTALLIADAILNQPVPAPGKRKKKEELQNLDTGNLRRMSSIKKGNLIESPTISDKSALLNSLRKGGFQNKSTQQDNTKGANFSKQEQIILTSKLANAIAERRKLLTKHDIESESDDDWSDSD